MWAPKLACCNLNRNPDYLRRLAQELELQGVEWTIGPEDWPLTASWERQFVATLERLEPLEIRLHLALPGLDLGEIDPERAALALRTYEYLCQLAAKLRIRYLTIHLGLGRESTAGLEWELTLERLAALVRFAQRRYVKICLENLAWGWTSRPELYEKLLRKTGAWSTFDLGHAAVCAAVVSTHFQVADFVLPHPERVVSAHIYDIEDERGHQPPTSLVALAERLDLLRLLPWCQWWVLELHEESALWQTWQLIRAYLAENRSATASAQLPAP